MKKIYFLIIFTLSFVANAQIISDDFNYSDNALLNANGWNVLSGAGTNAIDVGASNGLSYTGYTGAGSFTNVVSGNAAKLDNTGEDVSRTFTTVTSGSIYYSFLVNVTAAVDGYYGGLLTTTNAFVSRLFVKPSATAGKINFGISNGAAGTFSTTDFDLNTTYLIIVKYDVSATGSNSMWVKTSGVPVTEAAAGAPDATASGSGSASIGGIFLRQYNAGQNVTIDAFRAYGTWFNATPCALSLGTETKACDMVTSGIDTYTTTIPFTGGGTATYMLSASSGTISGDNPSTTAMGNIIISGVTEGVNVTLTVSGGCSLSKLVSASECKPVNTLPYYESFDYTVGSNLNAEQKWTILNTGDNVTIAVGNLTYPMLNPQGNSASFSGTGAESRTPFTSTNSGAIYASFAVNVTDLSNVTTDLATSYFAYFADAAAGSTTARLWSRRNGTGIQYGLSPDTAIANIVWSSTIHPTNTVVFVTLGYDFAANSLTLIENPTIGGTGSVSVAVTPTTAYPNLGGFVLRQDSATTTPSVTVDELRIDTSITLYTLSNESFTQIDGLKMYPNPAKNNLYIETALNSDINVVVYDLVGKQVLNTTVVNNTVNIAALNAGIYVVEITEEGKKSTKKLVIE